MIRIFCLSVLFVSCFADESICRVFSNDSGGNIELAKVAKPAILYGDSSLLNQKECPALKATCIDRFNPNRLSINQIVLAGKNYKGMICVGIIDDRAGWVDMRTLAYLATPPFTADNLIGKWAFGENELQFKNINKKFQISGYAVWHNEDIVHDGEISFLINRPNASKFFGADSECKIDFALIDKYLIVSDNYNCGGANVRFNGIYIKAL